MKDFMLQKWTKEKSFFEKALLPDGKNHWPRDLAPGEQSYKEWLEKVTDPVTGEFYKGKRVISKFDDEGKEIVEQRVVTELEPDYVVQQIVRIKVAEGEFLYSKGMMTGYTQFGVPITKKFWEPEVWNEQTFSTVTQMDTKDQKWKPMINGPSIIITHYDLPFNEENVMKLYNKRDPKNCQLTVKDEPSQRAKECPNLDMFIHKPFEYILNDEYLSVEQKALIQKEFEAEFAKQNPRKR